MKKSVLFLSILVLGTALSAHAADKKDPPPKRPATAAECDPGSRVTLPEVDYRVCEESAQTLPQ